jgi:hypothetical protein
MARNERGVGQIPDVDGLITLVCRNSQGAVLRKVSLSASIGEEWVAWELRKCEQWLDRYDPVLRLVSGDGPPG